jgi:hypothetical protein
MNMRKFLFGIFVVSFAFCVVTGSTAQDSRRFNGEPASTKTKLSDSKAKLSETREKAGDSNGNYQNSPDSPSIAAAANVVAAGDSINSPKETIFGMDPTIALFVVFGVFLVLVVVIVASSRGNHSHH